MWGNQKNPRHGLETDFGQWELASGLEIRSIPWLPGLEYDAVTFGAEPKAEYEV